MTTSNEHYALSLRTPNDGGIFQTVQEISALAAWLFSASVLFTHSLSIVSSSQSLLLLEKREGQSY